MTVGPACEVCTSSAYAGVHEPFLVDDLAKRVRLWRCSRCGTLWREGDPFPTQVSPDQADREAPEWREAASWLASTTLVDLLQLRARGSLSDRGFAVAALHHDALASDAETSDLEGAVPLVMYSGSDAALADGQAPTRLSLGSVAQRVQWTSGRRRVVFDPGSPWEYEPDDVVVEYLDANGQRTVTESDRIRSSASDQE